MLHALNAQDHLTLNALPAIPDIFSNLVPQLVSILVLLAIGKTQQIVFVLNAMLHALSVPDLAIHSAKHVTLVIFCSRVQQPALILVPLQDILKTRLIICATHVMNPV